MKQVYICSDTVNGVFSAIYDAWKTKLRGEQLGIVLKGNMDQELFCEYKEVQESQGKALAVEKLIKKHLGYDAYWDIYHAVLSDDHEKGNAILGAMLEAKEIGDSRKIMQHLSHPQVRKVFELCRKVSNEAHFYKETVRFSELDSGMLFAIIEPKNQVLTCLGDHFSNRFPLEDWMIYDKTHQVFLVHPKKKHWVLVVDEKLNERAAEKISSGEHLYVNLWKEFFKSISIRERESYERQRNNLPLRYRKHMTEFE